MPNPLLCVCLPDNLTTICAKSRALTKTPLVFQEVGPYDVGWKPRKHSWVQKASILFVDNPVGTGFSYVENGTNFTHNNAEIAADLLTFLKKFLHEKTEVRQRTAQESKAMHVHVITALERTGLPRGFKNSFMCVCST